MDEKTKIMLIEYMTVLGVVVGLVTAGILSPVSWEWIKPLLIGLIVSVFGVTTITNHIPSLITSIKRKQPSITDESQSPQVEPSSNLETKMGGFIDLASDVLKRGVLMVDDMRMKEIEDEHDGPDELPDPEIEVKEEVVANAEEKIKNFLLKSNDKDL